MSHWDHPCIVDAAGFAGVWRVTARTLCCSSWASASTHRVRNA